MARVLNRTEMAVYLYAYRHRIALRQTVKNPLMRNLVEIKFGNVEYFHPTKEFYKKTGISQRRWVSLVFGYAQPTQEEMLAAAREFRFSMEETFKLMDSRQMTFEFQDE